MGAAVKGWDLNAALKQPAPPGGCEATTVRLRSRVNLGVQQSVAGTKLPTAI